MARIVMCGWETGSVDQLGVKGNGGGFGGLPTVVSSTPTARSGTYCLKIAPGTFASNSVPRMYVRFSHATLTELYYAFGVYRSNVGDSTTLPAETMFAAYGSDASVNLLLSLDPNGVIRAYTVGVASGTDPAPASAVLLGTASGAVQASVWTLIELRLIASATSGTVEVRQNGVPVLSLSGVRTVQNVANYASFQVEFRRWVAQDGLSASFFAFDDVRVNDTSGSVNNSWPGDGSIRVMVPNGVGTTIGGTPLTPTGSATNWQNVDETPPSTTDYNAGTSVGTGETYALTDAPSNVSACMAIDVIAYALNADASGGNFGVVVRSGGANSESAAVPLTVSPLFYHRLLETDPTDSAAWTAAKLTALEAGVVVR